MFKFSISRKHATRGLAPGSRVFVGKQKMAVPRSSIFDFNEENTEEREVADAIGLGKYMETKSLTWINVDGVHDPFLIEKFGKEFNLDPLVQEDIMNTNHRPKLEDYDDYLFIVLKMIWVDEKTREENAEQISIILGSTYLITFQERTGDVFEPVRDRIRKRKGSRVRTLGIDYLAYSLLDVIIDNYIHLLDILGDNIEDLEDEILEGFEEDILSIINDYKRDVNYLRKQIRPVREYVTSISKMDSDLIRHTTQPFIKDLQDHVQNAYENVETYREMLNDYITIYHTRTSTKLNDVMRILTIFSAVFIPLTFIAGVYGTNFQYFPELHMKYAYPVFWAAMIGVGLIMLAYFKRKRWL